MLYKSSDNDSLYFEIVVFQLLIRKKGRFLQIRVHLQHLGFPIANDALYLHSNVAKRSKRNTTADRAAKLTEASEALSKESSCTISTETVKEIINDAELDSNSRTVLGTDATDVTEGEAIHDKDREQNVKLHKSNEDGQSRNVSKSTTTNFVVDPLCTHCPNLEPSGCVSSVTIICRGVTLEGVGCVDKLKFSLPASAVSFEVSFEGLTVK